jgi:hypothetical protein
MKFSSSVNELQAILVDREKENEAGVCLLVDSPYRILRVSIKNHPTAVYPFETFMQIN